MKYLGLAIAIAAEGFKYKVDKAGQPYILHCWRVKENCRTDDEYTNCTAMLHDTVEDGVCTIDELWRQFPPDVVIAVNFLTHDKKVPYMDYIRNLAGNEIARKVKLADLKDNSDITRLKGLTAKDFKRMEKYHTAYTYLSKI